MSRLIEKVAHHRYNTRRVLTDGLKTGRMTDWITPLGSIDGVRVAHLPAFSDERGRFQETFRQTWFPEADWSRMQSNRSDSKAQVLRGLHYHFHQVDYWQVAAGVIRAGLVDLRPHSPTFMQAATLEMTDAQPMGLFIPIGVAHGFLALTDCTLIYIVNNYYDGKDEFGVAWNDPAFGLDWGTQSPLLSPRDLQNRPWQAIPAGERPR